MSTQQQQWMEVARGNLLLMEATFMEIVSNIRALVSSNQDLEEALVADPHDLDFQQALKENRYIILKKRQQLVNLVTDMKRMGANIDVPDDIQQMHLDLNGRDNVDAVVSAAGNTTDNRTEENLVLVEDQTRADQINDGGEEGIYL